MCGIAGEIRFDDKPADIDAVSADDRRHGTARSGRLRRLAPAAPSRSATAG